jgi:hypothetical protein
MDDCMDNTSYGRAALRRFGVVPEGFHVFHAGWLGKCPEDWTTMRVRGAQFKDGRRIPRTTMTVVVTREEMAACKAEGDSDCAGGNAAGVQSGVSA